jgi:hypothetical protein
VKNLYKSNQVLSCVPLLLSHLWWWLGCFQNPVSEPGKKFPPLDWMCFQCVYSGFCTNLVFPTPMEQVSNEMYFPWSYKYTRLLAHFTLGF